MKKKRLDTNFVLFIVIAFTYAVFNFIWWQFNAPIIPYSISAVHFLDIFQPGWLFYNAPLITYIMRFMFFVFGKEHFDLLVIFVNYIFFLIPLYFVYKIGVEIKNEETGNLAMILFALSPAVYGLSRQYGHQDYHIIAAITFNIYSLIKSDYFKDRKWSVIYGVSVGLGLMIKDSFTVYFFIPFAYSVFVSLKDDACKIKISNITAAVIIGSLIACWHYFRAEIINKIINEPVVEKYPVFSFESLRVMSTGLWEELLSPPVFAVFIIGLIYFIWKYRGKNKNQILLWFIIPWAVIMLMPHSKIAEYGAGFIPAAVLIGAVFIESLRNNVIKKLLVFFVVLVCSMQYIDFSCGFQRGLFNAKFEFAYKTIKYSDGRLIFYDKTKSVAIMDTVKYLKKNYSNNTFFIEDFSAIDSDAFMVQMFLNSMKCSHGYYDENVLKNDIIIITGKPKTIYEAVNLQIKRLDANGFNYESEFTQLVEKNKYVFDEIRRNYQIIDVFYPAKQKDERKKITLLGRNDKFAKS